MSTSPTGTDTTPTSVERARLAVRWEIDSAIERALSDLDRLVSSGEHSESDITSALSSYPDFKDAWEEYRS